jgi:preprotein translocase subunit Sss1
MLKKAAMATGIVFLIIGIAGFIPGVTTDDQLLGLFRVDTVHNLVHIISGLAFLAASQRVDWSRLAFQAMAVVYGLVTIIGFIVGVDNTVLGLFHVDTADNWLHVALTAAFVYFGFIHKERGATDRIAA